MESFELNSGTVEILDARNKALLPVGTLSVQAHQFIRADVLGRAYLVLIVQNAVVVYSLEDPAKPRRVGSVELGFFAQGLADRENILYANGEQKFAVVDLQNPIEPNILGGWHW